MSADATKHLISATDLSDVVSRYMDESDAQRVYDAFLLAAEAHDGVVRKSGEFYIFHPLEVAHTLAELHMDADTICAALLHDVIEDTDYTKADLAKKFGAVVADLVDGVTKLAGGEFTSRQEASAASFHKMMLAMTQDFRVVLIKLADRLHNVKTLGVRKADAKRRIAQETLDIHVPLARRLGMNALRKELQVTAFKHLHPWRAALLSNALDNFLDKNAVIHNEIIDQISYELNAVNIESQVFSWEKNIYRLYQRIKNHTGRKHIDRHTEALELRVLVGSTAECYLALGVIHQLYQPKVETFKDFIATPKGYGFQGLQTALLTPQKQLILIQIQSYEMYKIAQYGITAHWRYPELLSSSEKSQKYLDRWLQQVKEIQSTTGNAAEFLEDMKADLFLNEIYINTPNGETKVLPKGATPIDFAYAIHTEVGNKCVGARIDGDTCSLNTLIPNGATVEIITDEDAVPHSLWLNFAITAKARSSIRSSIKKRKSHEFIALGKQILEKTLKRFSSSYASISEQNIQKTLEILNLSTEDNMFKHIAKGSQSAKLVARRLLNDDSLKPISDDKKDDILFIKGTEGLAVHLQTCCHPIPSDIIVAQLDEIRGLEVHRNNCPSLIRATKETLSVAWMDDTSHEPHFLVPISVQLRNRVGALSHITRLLENMRVNIEDINISGDSDIKNMYFLLQVEDENHLQKIMSALNNQAQVINVTRTFEK